MQVAGLVSLLALASQQVAALTRRGAPAHADGLLPCTFMVNFAGGIDGEKLIHDHFTARGVDYTLRVSHNDDVQSFVSFEIHGKCSEGTLLDGIPRAVSYSNVRELKAPVPASISSGAAAAPKSQEQIHSITGVNEARTKLGLTGKGIKVAVIDSGVYYLHPALGGGIGPNFKVLKGYDFVGNSYNGTASTLSPGTDPLDNCSKESHGTHVAGIIAADARNITDPNFIPSIPFTGVAPEANLLAYRVFGCDGKTGDDIVTKAILMAAADGADVINLSLGGGPAYNDEPQDLAADRVGREGHFVIASAGNDGASGIFTTGNPSNSRGALSIASFDNVAVPYQTITVDGAPFIYNLGSNNPNFNVGQTLDVVVNNLDADAKDIQDDGIGAAGIKVNATGKALMLRWGDKSLGGSKFRCTAAAKAGASACILYNNEVSMFGIAGADLIPSLLTSNEGGKAIIAAFKSGKAPKVVFTQNKILSELATAGTISDFSSAGIDLDLNIKPDVGGIGGQVLSTISPHSAGANKYTENYGVMSGTSMSSPYVAGTTALILQARKKSVNFEQLRGYIQNNANPRPIFQTNVTNSVAYQGSGLINAFYAASSKNLVLPSAIALNDTDNFVSKSKFTVTNQDTAAVTYTFSTVDAATVNAFTPGDDFTQDAQTIEFTADQNAVVSFKTSSVTVAAGASVDVSFTVTSPAAVSADAYPIYSGYIIIKASNQPDHDISIPYAGMIGSYKSKAIWTRNSASLAKRWAIAKQLKIPAKSVRAGIFDNDWKPLSEGYKLNGTDGVYLLAAASGNSRSARIELIPQGSVTLKNLTDAGFNTSAPIIALFNDLVAVGNPINWFADSLIQRNTFGDGQSVLAPNLFGFNGLAFNASLGVDFVPAGTYKVKFTALKNFAAVDSTNPADYDAIEIPTFNIFYDPALPIRNVPKVLPGTTTTTAGTATTADTTTTAAPVSVVTNSYFPPSSSAYIAPPVPASSYSPPKPSDNLYKSGVVKMAGSALAAVLGAVLIF
ncbi:peptidase S8/S53 domain-containing protein [Chytriomyces sp. MP71]|nr:peptidase S8/S53 domain-containing protein [Chytriomyces sp. MP71]